LIKGGGSIRLVSPFPRAASALLDPSSKAAATKMEKVRIMALPPSCVANPTEVSWDGSMRSARSLLKLKCRVALRKLAGAGETTKSAGRMRLTSGIGGKADMGRTIHMSANDP
jgi:hypothetical protein